MLAVKFGCGSAWLSGLCGGGKVKTLRVQGVEWIIYKDAELRKNHDRSSEEESHRVQTTRAGLTRKDTGNLSKGVNKEQGHLPYLQILKYIQQ